MSGHDKEHDRLIERLRAGLDDFTASVRRDPPDLDMPTAAATERLGGDGGRGRWVTSAAASIFVVAAIGGIVWVAGDADAPSESEATQPKQEAATTAQADVFGEDTPVSSDSDAAIFYDDPNAPRIRPLYAVDGTLTVVDDCVVLDLADGKRLIPVWPDSVTWTGEAMWFSDGTAIAANERFHSSAGAGVVRTDDAPGWQACGEATGAAQDVWLLSEGLPVASGSVPPAVSAPVSTPPSGTVSVIATVLEDGNHGPQLCSAVAESYPPQCGGADITGWDWSAVDGEESANGTTWGEYVLVGTYNSDGTVFTLSETPRVPTDADREQPSGEPDFSTPCTAPEGGWNSPYPDKMLDESVVRRRVKTYGGMWIDESTGVYNVRVVGDQAAHDQASDAIAAVYSGPVCVVEATHTMRELTQIQRAISKVGDARIVSIGTDVLTGQVQVSLTASAPELEERFADLYGDAVSFEHLAQPAGGGSQPSLGEATASPTTTD